MHLPSEYILVKLMFFLSFLPQPIHTLFLRSQLRSQGQGLRRQRGQDFRKAGALIYISFGINLHAKVQGPQFSRIKIQQCAKKRPSSSRFTPQACFSLTLGLSLTDLCPPELSWTEEASRNTGRGSEKTAPAASFCSTPRGAQHQAQSRGLVS